MVVAVQDSLLTQFSLVFVEMTGTDLAPKSLFSLSSPVSPGLQAVGPCWQILVVHWVQLLCREEGCSLGEGAAAMQRSQSLGPDGKTGCRSQSSQELAPSGGPLDRCSWRRGPTALLPPPHPGWLDLHGFPVG